MQQAQPSIGETETNAENLLRAAQRKLVVFKTANMLEKPALAEQIMTAMLDACQLMAADIRIASEAKL